MRGAGRAFEVCRTLAVSVVPHQVASNNITCIQPTETQQQHVRSCHRVVKSPYSPVAIPPVSVTDFVWAGLGAFGDRTAMLAADTGAKISYAELRIRCKGLASWLHDNLPPESVLAVLLPDSAEFAVAALGGLEAGLVVSTLNPDFTEIELTRLLKVTNTSCVVTTSRKIFTILEAKYRLEKEVGREFPIKIISVDRDVRFGGVYYLDKIVKEGRDLPGGKAEAKALLLGKDKWLTHSNLVASCQQVGVLSEAQPKVACLSPMHLQHGLTQVLLQGLARGATLVTLGELKPEGLVSVVRQHGVTALPAAAGLAKYLASGRVPREALSTLRSLSLADPLPATDMSRLLDLLPRDAEVVQVYCPSQGAPVFHQPRSTLKAGSVGRPLPSTEVKVISGGEELAAKDSGEICVRGPQFDPDNFIGTGETGYYDEDGYFYITGRVHNAADAEVWPGELESILNTHPEVEEVVVIEAKGHHPVAVVVPRELTHPPTSKELMNFVSSQVPPNKRLSNVVFVPGIPKLPDGTPDRVLLQKQYCNHRELEIVALPYI